MPHMREVKTCDRCRHFKRRCDLLKPSCSRCLQAGVHCSFDVAPPVASSAAPGAASPPTHNDGAQGPSAAGLMSPSNSTDSPESFATASGTADRSMTVEMTGVPLPAAQRVVRKRKRNCLSCLRCHRLKVKCDKELPCGRCQSSGNGKECYYSYNKGPNGGKFPCPTAPVPPPGENAKTTHATWHATHKVRGSSHWRELMTRIGSLTALDSPPLAAALENVATNACLANFALPGNFPFGTPGATKYFARDTVVRLLEAEKKNTRAYFDKYLDLLECVNPILDLPKFNHEIEEFWKDPTDVSLDWLSQFLMVLGLGCFATAEESHQATELMMAAEACLMQTPFMFRPTALSLRALSLMVVAKQVCNSTCWAVDSCWSLLGLLVRLAFVFGLPQETADSSGGLVDGVERNSRRRLWITILYLDMKVSMGGGMPPLTRPNELADFKKMTEWGEQPDSLHMLLYRSLPTVLEVLGKVNSEKDQIDYVAVLHYNTEIRGLLRNAENVCPNPLQRMTVDIFLRRCLMVLHRPFALHPQGPVLYPESYWSSLECSLALLIHYREMWCSGSDRRLDLVGRAFVLDFFSATLTAIIHVLRKDAPLSGSEGTGCRIPPRQLILETLTSCVEIWGRERESSLCYRTGYNIMKSLLDVLPHPSECDS